MCMEDSVAPEMLRMSLPTLSGLALVLPDELRQPAWTSNFAAIRSSVAIREDIDAAHPAALDGDRIVNVEVLADHMVEDENPTTARFPYAPSLNFRQTGAWKCSALRIRQPTCIVLRKPVR